MERGLRWSSFSLKFLTPYTEKGNRRVERCWVDFPFLLKFLAPNAPRKKRRVEAGSSVFALVLHWLHPNDPSRRFPFDDVRSGASLATPKRPGAPGGSSTPESIPRRPQLCGALALCGTLWSSVWLSEALWVSVGLCGALWGSVGLFGALLGYTGNL